MNLRFKIILSFFIVALTIKKSNAQNFIPDISHDSCLLVKISSSAQMASSSLNNDLIKKFIWGGYISEQEKTYALKDLHSKNIFGSDVQANFEILFPTKNKANSGNLRFGLTFSQIYHFDALFSKQMANLILNGNESTRGEYIKLGENKFNNLNFNIIKIQAFSKSYFNETTHTIGFGLGLVNGISNTSLKLYNADLYTENEGSYIDLNYSGILNNTHNIESKNVFDYKGIGTSLDLFYQIENNKGFQYTLFIENAGVVKWKPNANTYSNDTSIHFEGLYLNNITDLGNTLSSESIDSTMKTYYPQKSKGSYTSVLPIKLLFSIRKEFSKKLNVGIILKKQLYSNYEPRLDAEITYKFIKNLSITFMTGYGGYCSYWFKNDKNKYSTGLNIEYQIKNKFYVSLGSPYLNYMRYGGWMSGMGAIFNLKLWI